VADLGGGRPAMRSGKMVAAQCEDGRGGVGLEQQWQRDRARVLVSFSSKSEL
jgi:hypothetical protein